jgi:hypothetical protein
MNATAERTYFGWHTIDGRRAVAVLSGSVMTPLRAGSEAPAPGLSWGHPGPGARALGQAILADLLGPEGRSEDLLEPFVGEVVTGLPEPDFALPATSVLAWADRRGADGPTRELAPTG